MNNIQVSKNFKLREFECNDGSHLVKLDSQLLDKLQKLRDRLGVPLFINSAYRTEAYNRKVGGAAKSQHLYGKAVDVSMRNVKLPIETVKDLAIAIGFKGIGLYDTFIHLDMRSGYLNQGSYHFFDYRTKK